MTMTPNDSERFAHLLEGVAEYYDKEISAARIVMYFNALSVYDYATIAAAIQRHMLTSRFFPQASDLRNLIEGSEEDRTELSWSTLNTAIRRLGGAQSVIFEDGAFARAVARVFGSWSNACDTSRESDFYAWTQIKRTFVAAYRIARGHGDFEPVLLTGTDHAHNVGRFQQKMIWFGVVRADGHVESRRLPVGNNLLPEMPLPEALALPPTATLLALGDGRERDESESEPCTKEEFFERLRALIGAKSFGDDQRKTLRDLSDEEWRERRGILVAQAGWINNNGDSSRVEDVSVSGDGQAKAQGGTRRRVAR